MRDDDVMKMLGYDEVDGQQVLGLNLTCFNWMLTPEQVDHIRKIDPRCPDYFALYAVENDKVLSQVGYISVDAQTVQGPEKVGFVWGVATRQGESRKGLAGMLMEECHRRMQEEGIRYSILGTGKSIVAYNLYGRLGYEDFLIFNIGFKSCTPGEDSETDITYNPGTDQKVFSAIFEEYSNGLTGFIRRPSNFVEVRKAWSWMSVSTEGLFLREGKAIGYFLGSSDDKFLRIKEICCPNLDDISKCIKTLEMKLKQQYMIFDSVSRRILVGEYLKSGFNEIRDTWILLMVKDLKGDQQIGQTRNLFGFGEDRFQMTAIDEY
jgi:GNAT superfamily N-acetyltransferase